jgi:branched-subunit amino acid transport protein
VSPIGDGWPALAALICAAVLPTEVWRWIGLLVGRRIDPESMLLHWVRAVATAIIAAFVARAVFFPPGGLAEVPLWLRLAAMAAGAAAYAASRGFVFLGVGAAVLVLMFGQAAVRGW